MAGLYVCWVSSVLFSVQANVVIEALYPLCRRLFPFPLGIKRILRIGSAPIPCSTFSAASSSFVLPLRRMHGFDLFLRNFARQGHSIHSLTMSIITQ